MPSPLEILDECAKAFSFPALDNGYIYLAATRLSVYSEKTDWAIVIETFGSNPRAGGPLLAIDTFSTNLRDRNPPSDYVTAEAHSNYLANNPFNETRFFESLEHGDWIESEDSEYVGSPTTPAPLRGKEFPVPTLSELRAVGIEPETDRVAVFEAARYCAERERHLVLGTTSERRVSVPSAMKEVLLLDEWHHPDVSGGQLPSDTECFRQLAKVAESGLARFYDPAEDPNTHWHHWPFGGTL